MNRKQRILALLFLAILLIVSMSSFTVYFQKRQAQVTPTISKLAVIADVKTEKLQQWFKELLLGVVQDLENKVILSDALTLLQVRLNIKPEYRQAYARLKNHFRHLDPKRLSISILSNNGIVIFSTDQQQEGNYQPLQNTTTYFTLDQIQQVTPNLYESTLTRKPMMTLAVPLNTDSGKRIGALAIDVNLEDLDRLVRQPLTSLTPPDSSPKLPEESYLVGRISSVSNTFLTVTPEPAATSSNPVLSNRRVDSLGIAQALQGQKGAGLYLNYNRTPVLGVYRWLPQYRLALIVEVKQSEIFADAQNLARQIFLGGILMSLIIVIALSMLSRSYNFL